MSLVPDITKAFSYAEPTQKDQIKRVHCWSVGTFQKRRTEEGCESCDNGNASYFMTKPFLFDTVPPLLNILNKK